MNGYTIKMYIIMIGESTYLSQKFHLDRAMPNTKNPSRYATKIRDRSNTAATIAVARYQGIREHFISWSSRLSARDSDMSSLQIDLYLKLSIAIL